jgi:uncharacterized protein YndB with AHSA1/START domain
MTRLQVKTDVPTDIQMTRTFDAPRRLVIRAMTEPALIKKWLGNSRAEIIAAEVDFRVGGSYRYVFRRTDGVEFSFTGVYREIGEDRVVHTERFDNHPEEATITTTWTERDGKTTMTLVMRFSSQAVRDMVIATGMESGAAESYDNLEALVTGL